MSDFDSRVERLAFQLMGTDVAFCPQCQSSLHHIVPGGSKSSRARHHATLCVAEQMLEEKAHAVDSATVRV